MVLGEKRRLPVLKFYLEICFMVLGFWILLSSVWAPWVNYVCGALIVVLSLVKIFH